MEELIKYLKATQLEGIKGMKLEGEIPVSEKQLNELLEQFVRPQLKSKTALSNPTSSADSDSGSGSDSSSSMMELLPYLNFPVLKVKVQAGSLVLKVKVEV